MSLERFPDLYRYRRQELKPQRVLGGISLIAIVGLCTFLIKKDGTSAGLLSVATALLFYQAIAWVIMAPTQSSGAISSERSERTWDFQRLTPLTSFQTAIGKLFGAPIFALTLGTFLIPWSLIVTLTAGTQYFGGWFRAEIALIGMAFLSNSIGLLVSANPSVKHGRTSMIVGPIIGIAVLAINSGLTVLDMTSFQQSTIKFYNFDLSYDYFFLMNLYVFGAWCFIGAKWEIARDYLEVMKPWRLSAFLLFVAAYVFGFVSHLTFNNLVLLLMALFLYGTAVLQPLDETSTLNQWLSELKGKSAQDRKSRPIWVFGYLTFMAVVLTASVATGLFTAVSLLLFLLRDLLILECGRYLKFKQAKSFVVWATALLYFVPILFSRLLPAAVVALFIPRSVTGNWSGTAEWIASSLGFASESPTTLLVINCASGLVQVAIAWGLATRLARSSTRNGSASPRE